jgi:hypothetical protein
VKSSGFLKPRFGVPPHRLELLYAEEGFTTAFSWAFGVCLYVMISEVIEIFAHGASAALG